MPQIACESGPTRPAASPPPPTPRPAPAARLHRRGGGDPVNPVVVILLIWLAVSIAFMVGSAFGSAMTTRRFLDLLDDRDRASSRSRAREVVR